MIDKLIKVLQYADELDKSDNFILSDKIFDFVKLAAVPYHPAAHDELPPSVRFRPWRQEEQDYKNYDNWFYELFFKHRLPEYATLNGALDDPSLETKLHGPDPVPGPAYIDPTSTVQSPSMSGHPEEFLWSKIKNETYGPEAWKNFLPRI